MSQIQDVTYLNSIEIHHGTFRKKSVISENPKLHIHHLSLESTRDQSLKWHFPY